MANRCKDLPDECWELIFKRLLLRHPSHLESPSLSCKRFLSITNTLRTHFKIPHPTLIGPLSKLFNRFPRLNSLDFSTFRGDDLHGVIVDVATSELNLKSLNFSGTELPLESFKILGSRMKNLKVLTCSRLATLRDIDLFVIADAMPFLEDLKICYPENDLGSDTEIEEGDRIPGQVGVTDRGIEVLSLKVKGLRKIDVCLTDIVVRNCSLITLKGIEFVMRNSPSLSRLSVQEIDFGRLDDYSICCARSISHLQIHHSVVSDECLHSLANAGIPLRRFSLSLCQPSCFTLAGISSFLNKYRSLESLSLFGLDFLTDPRK